jgi:hypothetical protein
LYFTDENYGVLMGGGCLQEQDVSNNMRSYYTTNGGNDWIQGVVNINDNNIFYYSRFSDPLIFNKNGEGYAASSGVIWKTENGGKEWNVFSNTGNLDWHEEITYYNGTILVPSSPSCTGNYAEPSDLRISTDDGNSWKIHNTSMSMFGTFLHDELRGWGVGFEAEIYYTSDGGESWELRNCGIENLADMDDIWFIDDTTGFVVGDGVYRYLEKSPLAPKILNDKENYICSGDSVVLFLDKEYNYVEWSTGENTQTITVREEGKYFAYAENSKCESGFTDTIEVVFYPEPELNVQKSDDDVLCEGDTLDINITGNFAEFYWSDGNTIPVATVIEDSVLFFTYISQDSCIYSDSIIVDFMPRDDIEILENSRRVLCTGYTVDLYATEGFDEYRWYKSPEPDILGNGRIYPASEQGFYYVVGINQYGCDSYSDTVFIEERDIEDALEFYISSDTVFNVGKTRYDNTSCRQLTIYNSSDEDFFINKLSPLRNIEFSVPKSQLPIIIPAKDSTDVLVCFNPTDIELQRDTLLIPDLCSDRFIPLKAEGVGFADTTDGRCEIPVEFELVDIVDEPFLDIRRTYPNPAFQSIKLEIIAGFTENAHPISISIFDIYGNTFINNNYDVENNIKLQKGNIAKEEIIISLKDFDSGMYFLKVQSSGITKYEKFIIRK